jgi:hypothetical protein
VASKKSALTPITQPDSKWVQPLCDERGAQWVVMADADGNPITTFAGGGGDGAIVDGVSSSIKATVHDYTNSNPLAVTLKDTNGDAVSIGGGTQYTEDSVAVANPVGTALAARRRDTLAGETSADGDVVIVNATDKGELYVKHVDTVLVSATQLPNALTGGNLSVHVASVGTVQPVSDNGASLTIDGTVAATQSGIWNVVADGAILDGVSSSIKATVLDYANSNPLAVRLTDTSGDYVGAGGGTQYTEDGASAADPTGTQLIARRRDTPASETTTDGDNTALNCTAKGELYVKQIDTQPISATALPLPTGAASSTNQTTIIGHLDGVEGLLTTIDADTGALAGCVGGTELQVDIVGALPAGTNNIGDVDILSLPNEGQQSMANSISVAVASDQSAIPVSGNVAHDAIDSGNPHKIGYKAIAHGANPTAVAAADRTDAYSNRHGIPFVLGGHPNVITLEAAYTGAQTDTAIVSVAGGAKIIVTQIQMTADNANTVDVGFRVGFGATNTPTTTGVVLTHPGVAPGSGISRGDGSGILGVGGDGEDLRVTSEVPTTGSIRILVTYFTIES